MATSPATTLRQFLIDTIRAEFSNTELVEVRSDRMHPAMQGPRAAVYPLTEAQGSNAYIQDTEVAVQVYLKWDPQVDPAQSVDPTDAETYAQRIREAVYSATHPLAPNDSMWDVAVLRVQYEADPTGNVSRFTMYVYGSASNFAETTG